jgi:hypothetical protein
MVRMKKVLLASFLIFCIVNSLSADDKIFRSLQFSAVVSINLDTMLTYDAIWNYGAKERNPIVGAYIDNLPLTLGIDSLINMTLVWGTNKIYKKNKTLAYAIVIGVNLIQAYCFYTHYQLRHQAVR